MKFKKKTLKNGLRVITVPAKGNPSVTVFVVVETGSNYETKEQNGLSHFLEHMCFKGTKRRPHASDIGRELDSLGAENNAFTSNEFTGYYAKAARKHFSKLFDIVSDMYQYPTLLQKDIDIERGVILEEISMYEDQPHMKVHEVIASLMYGDTPAGRPVIGPRENIKRFNRQDFVEYRNNHYHAGKTFVIVAGDVTESQVLKEVRKNFKNIKAGQSPAKLRVGEKQTKPALKLEKRKTDQTHMILAFRTFSAQDKRNPVINLVAEILGQGMSSRLFRRLRDEMGACYYVKARTEENTDHGSFNILTGINVSRAAEITRAILEECKRLINVPVPEEELNKAKEHAIGHLYMNLETTDNMSEFLLVQEIATHKPKTPQQIEKELRRVTQKDIMRVARDIFRNEGLNLAIVGDVKDESGIKKVLTLK